MKTLDYKFVNSQNELNGAINANYKMCLSIVNDKRGKFVVCGDNYKEVFEEITGHPYKESEGTFGIAFPVHETIF